MYLRFAYRTLVQICVLLIALFLMHVLESCNKQTDVPGVKPLTYLNIYNASPSYYNLEAGITLTDSAGHKDSLRAMYNAVATGNGSLLVGAYAFAHYVACKPGPYRLFFSDTTGAKTSGRILELPKDKHQSVYLADSLGYFTTIVTSDDTVRTEGMATIRLINLSPDAGPVNLALDSSAVEGVQEVVYGQVSRYVKVPVTVKSGIRVETAGDHPQLLSRKSFPLENAHCYTLILRGYINPPVVEGEAENIRLNKTISLSAIINQ